MTSAIPQRSPVLPERAGVRGSHPHPALFEAQRAQQLFRFAFDAASLTLTVTSDYLFRHTDNEQLNWRLELDGVERASGSFDLALTPQGSHSFTLLDRLPMLHQPGELWLNVEVVQPQATDWSKRTTAAPGISGGCRARCIPRRRRRRACRPR